MGRAGGKHVMGVGSHMYAWLHADTGDGAWDGVIPEPAQREMREAKGKVHEMGATPWWCARVCALAAADGGARVYMWQPRLGLPREHDKLRQRTLQPERAAVRWRVVQSVTEGMRLQGLGCREAGVGLGARAAGEPEGQRRRGLLAQKGAQEGAGLWLRVLVAGSNVLPAWQATPFLLQSMAHERRCWAQVPQRLHCTQCEP